MQPTIRSVSFATVQNVCFVNDRKSVFRERATTLEEIEALKQRSKETSKVKNHSIVFTYR